VGNGEQRTFKDWLAARVPPRVESWWAETKSTLWFMPTAGTVFAVIAAIALVYVDDRLNLREHSIKVPWLFGAGSDGARGVLTAISGSVITVIAPVHAAGAAAVHR
jgi:uncharacterized membrane protein